MLKLEKNIKLTKEVIQSANLTSHFEEADLQRIGNFVVDGYKADKQSRYKWERRMEAAMDLALQLQKDKTFPWQNASNVAFPLITIATLQFHSRAYPTLISGTDLVKMRVTGTDPSSAETDRAVRIGRHMSYQLLEEDQAWEEQQDRLLINVPIVGSAFKKSYYDAVEGHNISELVMAKDFVLDYFAKSVETARRKTHVVLKFRNEIYEKVKLDAYRNVLEEGWYKTDAAPAPTTQNSDVRKGISPPQGDSETPYTFLEQHCWTVIRFTIAKLPRQVSQNLR